MEIKIIKKVWHIVLFLRQDKELPQLMLPVMTTRQLRELGYPVFAFDQINEREEKIIGKKKLKLNIIQKVKK